VHADADAQHFGGLADLHGRDRVEHCLRYGHSAARVVGLWLQ